MLLLDTHMPLWAAVESPRLSDRARALITDPKIEVFVSVASLWEMSIKFPLGAKRCDPMPLSARDAHRLFSENGYSILPVTADHAAAVDDLPSIHGDPFDRMLVAQALTASMRLLTRDERLKPYGDVVEIV